VAGECRGPRFPARDHPTRSCWLDMPIATHITLRRACLGVRTTYEPRSAPVQGLLLWLCNVLDRRPRTRTRRRAPASWLPTSCRTKTKDPVRTRASQLFEVAFAPAIRRLFQHEVASGGVDQKLSFLRAWRARIPVRQATEERDLRVHKFCEYTSGKLARSFLDSVDECRRGGSER
jgi:hypothetical protein